MKHTKIAAGLTNVIHDRIADIVHFMWFIFMAFRPFLNC